MIVESRLISYEELISLGCEHSKYSCASAPSWVSSTTYWTGSADSTEQVWYAHILGDFGFSKYINQSIGIRPVIEIKLSEF